MKNAASYQELSRLYGFAPKSESASRLAKLVSRQDACVDELVKVIDKDPSLHRRLLRVANPGAENEAEYSIETVDEALTRKGLGCVLVLAMSTPLAEALVRTFKTMLSLELNAIEPNAAAFLEGNHLLGTIDFSGRAIGRVYFRMSLESARAATAAIIGITPGEVGELSEIRDAMGELLNIITGNFKSSLCDAALDCRIEPPEVRITDYFHTPEAARGATEHMAFRAGKIQLLVDVTANPWNQG